MGNDEEVTVSLFEMEKAGLSFEIIARLRAGQNILYSIIVEGQNERIELIPTLKEMRDLAVLFDKLSEVCRNSVTLDKWTLELIKRVKRTPVHKS